MRIENRENVQNGKGTVHFEYILPPEEMHGYNTLYARITLKPGCSVGYHVHKGNGEDYFVLSGEATINDNNEREVILHPGEHLFCPDGRGHSITNNTQEDVVFMALIVKSPEV